TTGWGRTFDLNGSAENKLGPATWPCSQRTSIDGITHTFQANSLRQGKIRRQDELISARPRIFRAHSARHNTGGAPSAQSQPRSRRQRPPSQGEKARQKGQK